jgi:hypothetical protein
MPANTRSPNASIAGANPPADAGRLSQNGQLIGLAIYGGLLLVGFFFGIVTGYESPVVVVKKEKEPPKPEAPKTEPPKVMPKITPNPEPGPEPKKNPEPEPPKPEPKKVEPKPEPKKADPTPPEPKGTAGTPGTGVAISFEKNVKPILRTYCFNCHGATGKPKGDVDLTSLAKILDPNNPPILKPGNPKGSAIYTTIEDMAMPPDGPRPGKQETELIKNWILGGAKP